jgi:hypothetical protein
MSCPTTLTFLDDPLMADSASAPTIRGLQRRKVRLDSLATPDLRLMNQLSGDGPPGGGLSDLFGKNIKIT